MTASPLNTDASVEVRKAVRFFWAWLILATSLSIAGNVTHAILKAPEGAVILAAVAAVVPPVILLGSTHSATLLIKTRRLGWTFVIALTLTIALAGCAFALLLGAGSP